MQKLSELTTMRVGGEPAEIIVAKTRDDLIEATLEVWRSGEDWLILGGGSNLVVADEVDDLRVIKVETKGIQSFKGSAENKTVLRIQAGENWDDFVDHAIEHGSREAPAYRLLSAVIKAGCRAAIKISEKV